MLKNYATESIFMFRLLDLMEWVVTKTDSWTDSWKKELKRVLSQMPDSFEGMGMIVSADMCREAIKLVDGLAPPNPPSTVPCGVNELQEQLRTLKKVIDSELSSKQFYFVRSDLVNWYDEIQFEQAVVSKFSIAIYDMEEAGKCFALGRHTACAFHLMRVIEAGLSRARQELEIEKHCPNWDATCRQIQGHIDKTNDTKVKKRWNDVLARIYAVKDAWRNPTMHIERRYGEEEASEVFTATKNLMNVLNDSIT